MGAGVQCEYSMIITEKYSRQVVGFLRISSALIFLLTVYSFAYIKKGYATYAPRCGRLPAGAKVNISQQELYFAVSLQLATIFWGASHWSTYEICGLKKCFFRGKPDGVVKSRNS